VTLAELARRLGCVLEGDGAVDVRRVAALGDAGPGDLSFLSNAKYTAQLSATRASAVIAGPGVHAPCPVLRSANPYLTTAEAIALLSPQPRAHTGISALAVIDPSAELGPDVAVGPFACIGPGVRIGARTTIYPHVVVGAGAVIGADCVLHAQVSVRERVHLGDRVVIQDAAVIGSDGFGFAQRADGSHQKIPQVGGVVIEDDVEIGAHSAVDRPAVGETRIAAGTKIDNLVQVAHGVKIGRHGLLAAQAGIAGSAVIDDHVTFAGQSGAVGHVHIGAGVVLTARSAATHDIEPGRTVSGFPAIDLADWRRSSVLFHKLPELRKQLEALEARLAELEGRLPARRVP
jgi:UDP-3-O-[3-hydroxymyristoyl] glucosamine N-acyltransferase